VHAGCTGGAQRSVDERLVGALHAIRRLTLIVLFQEVTYQSKMVGSGSIE
jgi:hypothetical protein